MYKLSVLQGLFMPSGREASHNNSTNNTTTMKMTFLVLKDDSALIMNSQRGISESPRQYRNTDNHTYTHQLHSHFQMKNLSPCCQLMTAAKLLCCKLFVPVQTNPPRLSSSSDLLRTEQTCEWPNFSHLISHNFH